VRYEHVKALIEYAKLQRAIAVARAPTAAMDVSEANITRSDGYRKLRAFAASLNDEKRARFIRQLQAQTQGVRDVMKLAAQTGEKLSLADVTIEVFDKETHKPITGIEAEHWQQRANDLADIRKQLEPKGDK
jgi:hypothetical protein